MTAVAGTDRTFWQDGIGLFGAGTPLANDAGIEVLRGLRDYAAVQRALARAGYNGEKVVVFAPTDVQPIHLLSLVGVDQLRRAGMNVDLQEMELVAALRRRQNRGTSEEGGWNAFFGLIDRSAPSTNPYGNYWIRADGLAAWDGWPTSPRIEPRGPPGSMPPASTSSGGSAPNCRCSRGRMCPTSQWANIGNPPPIGKI